MQPAATCGRCIKGALKVRVLKGSRNTPQMPVTALYGTPASLNVGVLYEKQNVSLPNVASSYLDASHLESEDF